MSSDWYAVIWLFVYYWFRKTSLFVKLFSLLCGLLFALVESLYCKITAGVWKTTWQQFIMSCLGTPIFIIMYYQIIQNFWLRLVLYPVDIWLWEFIGDRCIKSVYGRNLAWDYGNNKYSIFDGAIKLSYYFHWVVVGLGVELLMINYCNIDI